ncbi:MAG: hypothetical protein C0399_11295 [Syntrophus sp. (in: bacteria)]|nr:hypothetical protein [Syntrophus sp. (in: bacteria)]
MPVTVDNMHKKVSIRGFTSIELIIVISLLAILGVVVAARVTMTRSETANITAVDQAVAYIQYAQMRAMANRGTGVVGHTLSIAFEGSTNVYLCNNTTPCNSGAAFETLKLPADASVGTQTFTFNTLGGMDKPGNPTVSVGGKTITVYTITGKVAVPLCANISETLSPKKFRL